MTREPSYQEIVDKYQGWALTQAEKLLRKWGVINPMLEAEDAVQQWHVVMLESGMSRYDMSRGFQGFGYRILRRCCVVVLRSKIRSRTEASYDDPELTKEDWLDGAIATQEVQELLSAIDLLPQPLRSTVNLWLQHRQANLPMKFATTQESRQFHNRMFRARRLLRVILSDWMGIIEKTSEKNDVA